MVEYRKLLQYFPKNYFRLVHLNESRPHDKKQTIKIVCQLALPDRGTAKKDASLAKQRSSRFVVSDISARSPRDPAARGAWSGWLAPVRMRELPDKRRQLFLGKQTTLSFYLNQKHGDAAAVHAVRGESVESRMLLQSPPGGGRVRPAKQGRCLTVKLATHFRRTTGARIKPAPPADAASTGSSPPLWSSKPTSPRAPHLRRPPLLYIQSGDAHASLSRQPAENRTLDEDAGLAVYK